MFENEIKTTEYYYHFHNDNHLIMWFAKMLYEKKKKCSIYIFVMG